MCVRARVFARRQGGVAQAHARSHGGAASPLCSAFSPEWPVQNPPVLGCSSSPSGTSFSAFLAFLDFFFFSTPPPSVSPPFRTSLPPTTMVACDVLRNLEQAGEPVQLLPQTSNRPNRYGRAFLWVACRWQQSLGSALVCNNPSKMSFMVDIKSVEAFKMEVLDVPGVCQGLCCQLGKKQVLVQRPTCVPAMLQ